VNCAKTAEPIKMPFGGMDSSGKHVFDVGAHWRHLAKSIEPSMCGSDAAFCQINQLSLSLLGRIAVLRT